MRVDRQTLERFRDGDERAVKSVYDQYSGAVFAVAMSILRDRGRASDVTQQTFLKAWRSARSYDPDRPFGAWIYTIARRTAIDLYRKERRRFPSDDLLVVDDGPSMEAIWEVFEVRAALDRLSEEEREIMKMSHFDGLTHSEIAAALGIPLGTVKSRSYRTHQNLVGMLGHLWEGGTGESTDT